ELRLASIAIPPVSGAEMPTGVLGALGDAVVNHASSFRHLRFVSASDIESMIGFERQRDLVGCDSVSCMTEIGGALGVDALLQIKLATLGNTAILTGTLL